MQGAQDGKPEVESGSGLLVLLQPPTTSVHPPGSSPRNYSERLCHRSVWSTTRGLQLPWVTGLPAWKVRTHPPSGKPNTRTIKTESGKLRIELSLMPGAPPHLLSPRSPGPLPRGILTWVGGGLLPVADASCISMGLSSTPRDLG